MPLVLNFFKVKNIFEGKHYILYTILPRGTEGGTH